jgi:hypothetical protein
LYCTFLSGGSMPLLQGPAPAAPMVSTALLRPFTILLLTVAAALAAVIIHGLWRAWQAAGSPAGLAEALAYLALQTFSAALPILSTPLYGAALAMHYVEYHVLMYPRCFHSAINTERAPDRLLARLRRDPLQFYLVLIAISAIVYALFVTSNWIMGGGATQLQGARGYLAIAAIFDGLFVFHYFVEMYIWRFNDPFFRRTLSGLYFSRR